MIFASFLSEFTWTFLLLVKRLISSQSFLATSGPHQARIQITLQMIHLRSGSGMRSIDQTTYTTIFRCVLYYIIDAIYDPHILRWFIVSWVHTETWHNRNETSYAFAFVEIVITLPSAQNCIISFQLMCNDSQS